MQATESLPIAGIDTLLPWLRVLALPGLPRYTKARLVRRYGTPQALIEAACKIDDADDHAAHEHVEQVAGTDEEVMSPQLVKALRAPVAPRLRKLAEETLAWAALHGNHLVTLNDAAYPPPLREIADPPLLLHAQGDVALLQRTAFGVVGSRTCTAQGSANAQRFAQALSAAGLAIVSGLALGIDAAAHKGGLAERGSTIAVMGTGIDMIYPASNAALAARIRSEGCLLSEHALGTPPRAHHFPVRNRIISGLSRGVLVVEAAERSGSLITAHLAAHQGRDVFAVPGSIHSSLSKGCHKLLREGAKLVETVDDIFKEYSLPRALSEAQVESEMLEEITDAARALLTVLSYDPMPADELAMRLQLDAAATQASLLALELAGVVERLPGGVFQRLKR
ncbi:DNA processing protein [Pseudoduganella lurida]|uniref:DNA processing protein n=1 Tax=Pseudoduganella lurida TaxID=1036180 RepID=A0A562R3N9_9BURK|nr:DNA-processing protein DprA [Pseudoduganella lurida]TWI63678.1 DNA processing protein [Pseudoduganella lurida]